MALATFPPSRFEVFAMVDDFQRAPQRRTSDIAGDPEAPVKLYHLQLFATQIEASIAELRKDISADKQTREALQKQVATNAGELGRLRDEFSEERSQQRRNFHDLSNSVTALTLGYTDDDRRFVRAMREAADQAKTDEDTLKLAYRQKFLENRLYLLLVAVPLWLLTIVSSIIVAHLVH